MIWKKLIRFKGKTHNCECKTLLPNLNDMASIESYVQSMKRDLASIRAVAVGCEGETPIEELSNGIFELEKRLAVARDEDRIISNTVESMALDAKLYQSKLYRLTESVAAIRRDVDEQLLSLDTSVGLLEDETILVEHMALADSLIHDLKKRGMG